MKTDIIKEGIELGKELRKLAGVQMHVAYAIANGHLEPKNSLLIRGLAAGLCYLGERSKDDNARRTLRKAGFSFDVLPDTVPIKCPRCWGNGAVRQFGRQANGTWGSKDITCPTCKGSKIKNCKQYETSYEGKRIV